MLAFNEIKVFYSTICLFSTETLERKQKFIDQVSHTPWRHVTFSSNGSYVIGTPANTDLHMMNIWDLEKGSLAKIIDHSKEHIHDAQWHPIRCVTVFLYGCGVFV